MVTWKWSYEGIGHLSKQNSLQHIQLPPHPFVSRLCGLFSFNIQKVHLFPLEFPSYSHPRKQSCSTQSLPKLAFASKFPRQVPPQLQHSILIPSSLLLAGSDQETEDVNHHLTLHINYQILNIYIYIRPSGFNFSTIQTTGLSRASCKFSRRKRTLPSAGNTHKRFLYWKQTTVFTP